MTHVDVGPEAALPSSRLPASEARGWMAWRRSTPFWMGLILVAIVIGFGLSSPGGAFFTYSNFADMGLDASEGICLAIGMTFVLAAGQLDLSVGANLVLSGYLGAYTMEHLAGSPTQEGAGQFPHAGLAIVAGIAVSIAFATAFGLVNGLLVTKLKITSFIVTLATTGIATGAAYVISNGVDISNVPLSFQTDFGVSTVANKVPVPLLVAIAIAAVLWYVLVKTRFGVHAKAIGSSRAAAERAGIHVDSQIIGLFVLVGFLVGVASVIDISRFATTDIAGHVTDNLAAIAACVIGGTSLFGGIASVPGSIVGSLFPVVLGTGLIIDGVGSYWQEIAVGVILLIAVFLDRRRRSRLT